MAGALNTVYSVAVLVLALLGVAFVFTRSSFAASEDSGISRWGELLAVAVFLIAMVATLLLSA